MGRLRGTDGEWLESEEDKVDGLVRDLFGEEAAQDTMGMRERARVRYSTALPHLLLFPIFLYHMFIIFVISY